MKKNIIISSLILFVLVIFVLIPSVFINNNSIIKSLELYGFENSEDSVIYNKQLSTSSYDDYVYMGKTFDTLSYNLDSYELKRSVLGVNDDVDITYNGTLSYVDKNITFTYRVVYDESNIILNGTYNYFNSEFACEVEFIYGVELDSLEDELCNYAKEYSKELYDYSNEIFTEKDLKYINKNTGN